MQWMGLYEKTLPSKLATLASIERYVADAEDLLIQRVIEQDIARQQLTARGAPHDAPPFVVPNSKILGTTIEILWADGVWYLGRCAGARLKDNASSTTSSIPATAAMCITTSME